MAAHITFEEYLSEVFIRDNPEVTKDRFEQLFDIWTSGLEGGDFIELANSYGEMRELKAVKRH